MRSHLCDIVRLLWKAARLLDFSPATGLPGMSRISREVIRRMRGRADYAVCYLDIDRFQSIVDAYGSGRGDEFISTLAHCLHRAIVAAGRPRAFLGHLGGHDFVVVCAPEQVLPITRQAVEEFETTSDNLYDARDAARGYLELVDGHGRVMRPNLVTVSVGVALSTTRVFGDPQEVIAVANEMRSVAKKQPGSFVAYDRRVHGSQPSPMSEKPQTKPAPVASQIAQAAARVLAAEDRERYRDEYASELHELAATGTSRWSQLLYALRLFDRAWVLRAELRSSRLERARS